MATPKRDGADFCELPLGGPDAPQGAEGPGAAVRIYGKQGCPHTNRARQALPEAAFIDVLDPLHGPAALEEMLALSGGKRRVPVIVRRDAAGRETAEVGYRRGS
jgi:glutaredoxin